jgi:hypothetical protein
MHLLIAHILGMFLNYKVTLKTYEEMYNTNIYIHWYTLFEILVIYASLYKKVSHMNFWVTKRYT